MLIPDYLPQSVLDLADWCGFQRTPVIDRQHLPDWFIRHYRDAELLCERAGTARVPRPPSVLDEGRRVVLASPPGNDRDRADLALCLKEDRVGLVVNLAAARHDRGRTANDLSLDGEFRRDKDVHVTIGSWATPRLDIPEGLDAYRLHLDLCSRAPGHADFSTTSMEMDLLQVTALPGNGACSPKVALEVSRRCASFRGQALRQDAGTRNDAVAVLAFRDAMQPQMLADAERLYARWMDGGLPALTEASMEEALLDILREYPDTAPPPPIATERAVALLALAEELLKLPSPRGNQAP